MAWACSRRSSGIMPPWTTGNSAAPGLVRAAYDRAAHLRVRSAAFTTSASGAG